MFKEESEDISNVSFWQTGIGVLSHQWGTSKHITNLEKSLVAFNKVL